MRYPVYIEKDLDSDFGVTVPDLPGCFSGGATLDEAIENAEEAILTHIEGLMMDNDNIPHPQGIEEHQKNIHVKNIVWAIVKVDLGKLSGKSQRINITMPERILTKADAFATEEGESRSGLLSLAVMEYISRHAN